MQAIYKCRLCGKNFGTLYCSKETATRITYEYVCGLDPNKWLVGGRFYKNEVHVCDNGIGIGDFIGFEKENLDSNDESSKETVKEGYLGYC